MSEQKHFRPVKFSEDNSGMTIEACPRCGDRHEGLAFQTFDKPVKEPAPLDYLDPVIFHHWALCPNNGGPILIWNGKLAQEKLHRLNPCWDKVRQLAYKLWELEGRPHGRDQLHWEMAYWLVTSGLAFKIQTYEMMTVEMKLERKEFHLDILNTMHTYVRKQVDAEVMGDFIKAVEMSDQEIKRPSDPTAL